MVERIVLLVVLMVFGAVALGQNLRGNQYAVGPAIVDPRVPYLGPDGVSAALDWSASPESRDLRDLWRRTFHRSLVAAAPAVGRYDADDLCVFTGGSGGTSKVDGGGWLGALNPHEFDPDRDRVTIATAASLVDLPPDRLILIDDFDFGAITKELDQPEGEAEHMFLTSGLVLETARGSEVKHGHLVAHHVAALLREKDLQLSGVAVMNEGSDAPFVRLTFGGRLTNVEVDLYAVTFDDFASLQRALVAAADSADSDGSAAVVLSWGLTGCALRDAFVGLSTRIEGVTPVTVFVSLTDFALAVATEYDAAAVGSGAPSVTRQICEEVDAFSRFAVRGSSAAGCGNPGVRAVVATTVLFATYAELANSSIGDIGDAGGSPFSADHAYFASAGNEGLPYPMPPGSFEWVTAVAACKPTGPERAWFSNAGDLVQVAGRDEEVIALGAWYSAQLSDPDRENHGYWGTTFAAPLAALASGREGSTALPTFRNLCAPARWSEPGP